MSVSNVARIIPAASGYASIGREEFAKLIEPYKGRPLAVSVSGGADSLALLFLLARAEVELSVLSVDHKMRVEAKQELNHVAKIASRFKVPHIILSADGAPPKTQAEARILRFNLLSSWCKAEGIKFCALGHHRADQAETFLFRLARGSGIAGLAGMKEEYFYGGCYFIRPLLDSAPERLRATLISEKIAWCEDPSNQSPRYMRTHLGRALSHLEDRGLNQESLINASLGARCLHENLKKRINFFLSDAADIRQEGYCWLDYEKFCALPPIFAYFVLAELIGWVSGSVFRPAWVKLIHLYDRLLQGQVGCTLGGCQIRRRKKDSKKHGLLFFREFAHIAPRMAIGRGWHLWDRRFRVSAELDDEASWTLGALGSAIKHDDALLNLIAPTLPALRRDGELISVPHLGIGEAVPITIEFLRLDAFSVRSQG